MTNTNADFMNPNRKRFIIKKELGIHNVRIYQMGTLYSLSERLRLLPIIVEESTKIKTLIQQQTNPHNILDVTFAGSWPTIIGVNKND